VSLGRGGDQWRWGTATAVARPLLSWLLAQRPVTVLNLNVPNTALERVRGVRSAPLASFGAVQAKVTEIGHGYVDLEYSEVDPLAEPDSDATLLAHGWACISALAPLCEDRRADLSPLESGPLA
jgi:5'-nucleotidase